MATKKETIVKNELPNDEKGLQDMLANLRKDVQDQHRSVKTGTATNVRVTGHTRKTIARVLTKLKQLKSEGERSKK